MKRIATIAAAISLLVGSCVPSHPNTIPATYASNTIERTLELLETITPSAIATSAQQPQLPTKPANTATMLPPSSTPMALQELVTLDCSPAIHLMKLGGSNKPQRPTDLAVHEQIAYILNPEGLWLMDVSDPNDPFDVGFIPMLETRQVIIEGGYAYGIDAKGLWALELANSTAPDLIGYKDIPNVPMELSITEGFAYVRDNYGILHIYDLADPTAMVEIGVYDPPGQILPWEIYGNVIQTVRELANTNPLPSFSFAGEYLYIADLDGGLRVIEISDPTSPNEIGTNSLQVLGVEVVGDQAYIFEVDDLLSIIFWVVDISTPIILDDPTLLGMVNIERSLSPNGLCSFISRIYALLLENDLSQSWIAEINLKDFIAQLRGVDIVGDVIYIADEDEGLVILQMIAVED